jgi:CheY-like chemotaxis protein
LEVQIVTGFFYVLDQTTRILFVDDDPILREFAQVNLASPTAVVDVASNGAEALERLALSEYEIVLLDLEMPVLNGFDTLAAIRADPRFESVWRSWSSPVARMLRPSTGPSVWARPRS